MTASAKAVYKKMYEACAKAEANDEPANNHCTEFRMVDDAIQQLIPANPLDKRYALATPLKGIFRLKKGRLRICWMAHSRTRTILVMYISETPRKEGDKNDPYRVLTNLVKAGYYKKEIEEWQRLTDPGPHAPIH